MFKGGGRWVQGWGCWHSQALSHSCQRGVGKLACLNRSPRLTLSPSVCVCVNYLAMRAGVYCTTQVSARRLLQVCVCYFDIFFPLPSPHGLNTSAGSCSGLYARPVSTPISSSDLLLPRSADTISSPSFPAHLFPATYFPTDFFFFAPPLFPTLPLSCLQGVK